VEVVNELWLSGPEKTTLLVPCTMNLAVLARVVLISYAPCMLECTLVRRMANEDPNDHRPVILCEYSHAMGNSNGSLDKYWRCFRENSAVQGGFHMGLGRSRS
jgi:beta-galactosidase/beta-glucuronidase